LFQSLIAEIGSEKAFCLQADNHGKDSVVLSKEDIIKIEIDLKRQLLYVF
jgi:hypothetical protein